ncbi:seven transmembrane MLO family protein [Actinidia rufa]|uniref:Seven transmembrane MLO family protein n=1 Tax=Actinidia rufa TaxID=165716 RepID=A0A7J0DP18_9ERIC|nr:seven transmembrane MLO family protein [Actinidia rufa]
MSGYGTTRELDQTPTWAVAGVCLIIIVISIALEMLLHKLGEWFTERHKKALFEALEKVKDELMILGFISLILTFSQYYIAEICIPENVANTMLPCPLRKDKTSTTGRRLLWYEHRVLAAGSYSLKCKKGCFFRQFFKSYSFSLRSCFHDNFGLVIAKTAIGFGVLFFCSYVTLPLYALIAQMGSHMKRSIFDEQTAKALKNWQMAAKKRHEKGGKSPTHHGGSSPGGTFHQFQTPGHSARSSYEDQDPSNRGAIPSSHPPGSTATLVVKVDNSESETTVLRSGEESFAFVKP